MTKTLSFKDPAETIPVTFDFESVLGTESLIEAAVTASVDSGTDSNPSAILTGSPSIVGTTIVQMVTGGVSGADYRIRAEGTTGADRVLVVGVVLPVRIA